MEELNFVADSLADLQRFAPCSKRELKQWYESAHQLENALVARAGFSEKLPHFVWHYLSDADIRLKDSDYAEHQGRIIGRLIESLRRGKMPSDEEIGGKQRS